MNKMWIDIEDLSNQKYELGYIVESPNGKLRGYEFKINDLDELIKIFKDFNINEVLFFDGNDGNYIFNNIKDLAKQDEFAKNIFFKNVGLDYKVYLEGSKLQMAKNGDLAKAFGINVNFNRLHTPLYDIQLTYCAHHNFNIDNDSTRKDKIFDSFFVLTNKFDTLWKVLKKFNVPRQFVDVQIVKPTNPKTVYFVELKERSYEDKYLVFTDTISRVEKQIDINKDTIPEIIEIFEHNLTIFTDAQQQSNLSRHVWEIMYMNFETRKLNSSAFTIVKKLYIFMSINISRFKLAIDGTFDIDTIVEKLGSEITIDRLKQINKL